MNRQTDINRQVQKNKVLANIFMKYIQKNIKDFIHQRTQDVKIEERKYKDYLFIQGQGKYIKLSIFY